MFTSYSIKLEDFAKRHFVKNFERKYKKAWEITWKAMIEEFKRVDSLLQTSIAETIVDSEDIRIIKSQFRIAGTNESKKKSGNRCIIAVSKSTSTVHVLVVYSKNDLKSHSETAYWKQLIKENYKEYKNIL